MTDRPFATSNLTSTLRRSLGRLRHDLDEFTAGPLEPDGEYFDARPNRRLLWLDGFLSNISESFVTSFVNPFAMALGATNSQVGILNAAVNLSSALGLLPGAKLSERARSRKRVVVLTGGLVGRLLLIAIAAVPLVFEPGAVLYAVIAFLALRACVNQVGYPAWSALVADLVPVSMRGRYFGARNIGLAFAALIFTPVAGRAIEIVGGARGYQLSFFVAGLVGLAATWVFARIKERPTNAVRESSSVKDGWSLSLLRTHPPFGAFVGVALLWNLALAIAAPFFSVYLVRTLHGTPTQIGILAAVYSVGNIMGQRFWGRMNDLRGAAWVMKLTGLIIPAMPLGWSLVPGPWYLVPVELCSGFMWGGYQLATFNLLLHLSPEAQRERFVALYQTVVFGAAFIGPLLGAVLVNPLSVRPLMWISAAGRLTAALIFLFVLPTESKVAA